MPMKIAFVLILLYSLTMFVPMYYMVVNSFKRVDDYLENGVWGLPRQFWFQNYVDAASLTTGNVSFVGMYVNSIVFTLSCVLIQSCTTTMTAYVLARFRFYGRDLLVAIGVGSLVLPNLGSSSVVYKLYMDLNILDTWCILISYTSAFGLQFLVLYSLFRTVSGAYVEAARIDGAGEWCIFVKICLPMARGALGSTAVILALNAWNDYYTPYMYLPSIKTLSVGLQELSMVVSQLDKPKLFAGMMLAVLPILILFIFMKDTIIENTISGGIKG